MNFTTSRRARFWDILRLGALAVLVSPAALAQNRQIVQPDCVIDFLFTAAGQTAGGPGTCGNNVAGVYEWRLTYKSTGFSALSLVVQSAPDSSGAPGTWVTFVGTVTGSNPNTAIDQASTDLVAFNPWVRVMLTSKTGTGTITGELYGCRQPGCSIAGATITAIVAIPNPLPVDGPTAAGAAPTTPPVLVAGQDGAPGVIRTVKTDAVGELIPANASSAAVDGVSNTQATETGAGGGILFPRAFAFVFNNTAWDRLRGNTSGLSISNASTAAADGLSNTQISQTDVAGGLFYPRSFGHYFNGTGWDRTRGNTSGAAPSNASSAAADGASNTELAPTDVASVPIYARTQPYKFNGTTWDRDFVCTQSAAITFSGSSGSLQIVGLVASAVIRVCHVSISANTATNFTLQTGTGSNCGSGTASLSGAYNNVTTLALDLAGTLRTPASQELCINSSASITAGGLVTYAQF